MDKQERDRLRALARAATPGPWHRNVPPISRYPTIYAGRNTHLLRIVPDDTAVRRAEVTADYVIGASPDVLLHLVAPVDANLLARAIELLRAMMPQDEQAGEGGGNADPT